MTRGPDRVSESSYVVYIHKDTAKEQAMGVSEPLKLACSEATIDTDARTNAMNGEEIMPALAGLTATHRLRNRNESPFFLCASATAAQRTN